MELLDKYYKVEMAKAIAGFPRLDIKHVLEQANLLVKIKGKYYVEKDKFIEFLKGYKED